MSSKTQILDSYLAAGNLSTSVEQLCSFVLHRDERIRARVAEHPRLPAKCLAKLAQDESTEVKIAVAENPSTALSTLELLIQDPDHDVRYAIAENANTPLQLLFILADDEHPYIASRATETLVRLRRVKANVYRLLSFYDYRINQQAN